VKPARVLLVFAVVGVLGVSLSLVPALLRSSDKRPGGARPVVVRAGRNAQPVIARTPGLAALTRGGERGVTATAPSSSGKPSVDASPFHDVPEVDDLDAIQPGLATAMREARDEARGGIQRAIRRCALQLPDAAFDLEWDAIETFEPDGTGGAVLVSQELHPAVAGAEAFYGCLAEATLGQTRVDLPDGFDTPFQLHSEGHVILDPSLALDEIKREVAALRERLAQPGLTDSARAVLGNHLALYECYAARGPSGRRVCLEASLR
jgi:hypothetical protein